VKTGLLGAWEASQHVTLRQENLNIKSALEKTKRLPGSNFFLLYGRLNVWMTASNQIAKQQFFIIC